MNWNKINIEKLRPQGPGVIHPDGCPKLTLKGVEWAVPPRFPEKGVMIKPVFGETVESEIVVSDGENWPSFPEAEAFEKLSPEVEAMETCEACGSVLSAKIGVDPEADKQLINAALALTAALLRHNYDLNNSQLIELLTIEGKELPLLIATLMEWLYG